MTEDKKVSIIVPIYNAESTIEKCICSIIKQSYSNLEILLVNDGSADCSTEICNKYASMDERIIVLNKENGGVSSARNIGLEYANGEYCTFLDADDWIDSDHIMSMVKVSQAVDCVIEGYTKETETERSYCLLQQKSYDLENLQDDQICSLFINGFIHPCWNKLFKTKIIKANNIIFNTAIHISEDSLFCMEYLIHCHTIQVLDAVTYHYFVDTTSVSLSRKVYDNIFDIYGMVFSSLKQLLEKGNCLGALKEKILVQTIYPQVFVSALKIISNKNINWHEKKKILDSGMEQEYCKYVLTEEQKYNISKFEYLCLVLILKKRYKLLGAVLKWVNRKK